MYHQVDVLIIEDEKDFLTLIKNKLKPKEISFHIINYAKDAIEYINQFDPSIIVLDLKLPYSQEDSVEKKENGKMVFEAIQNSKPLTPIVLMSQYQYTSF